MTFLMVFILDLQLDPNNSEITKLYDQLKYVKKDDIIIFDRGYCSIKMSFTTYF